MCKVEVPNKSMHKLAEKGHQWLLGQIVSATVLGTSWPHSIAPVVEATFLMFCMFFYKDDWREINHICSLL
jgi:hypothetical protein